MHWAYHDGAKLWLEHQQFLAGPAPSIESVRERVKRFQTLAEQAEARKKRKERARA